MKFFVVVLILIVLSGCTGIDGRTYQVVPIDQSMIFLPEGHHIVPDSFEEKQYKLGVMEGCLYSWIAAAARNGIDDALAPFLAASRCRGYDDTVWQGLNKDNKPQPEPDIDVHVESF